MTTSKDLQVVQEIIKNVQARDIKTGDITQIYKTIVNLDKIPKPKGFPQNIISSNTDKFVGRERELEHLNQQLQRHNKVAIAAVEGMGGVGKTELAIQYSLLHLQLHTYPGGICWLRIREEDIGLQIVNFARTDLGLQPPEDLELLDRVRWCWKRWLEGNTLVVFDDVTNYSDIDPYLPPQPSQFKVLITTRLKLDLPSSLYLEILSEPDALELLRQLVGSEKVEQELATARELCQRLGYLPLALQLVGRYVNKRRISLTEELKRLEGKGLGHPSLSVPENDPTWTLAIKHGVEAAFELSWSELSDSARQLGCLLSLFALAPIPWSLVESAAVEQDPEKLEDARVELEDLHLLQSQDTYQLHQLIHEFLRNKQNNLANADKQKDNFCQAMVKVAQDIRHTLPPQIEIAKAILNMPHLTEVATVYKNWLSDEDLILIKSLKPIERWAKIAQLANTEATQIKAGDVKMELILIKNGEKLSSSESKSLRLPYKYQNGEWQPPEFKLKLTNTTNKALYCTLVNLSASFSISNSFFTAGSIRLQAGEEAYALDGEELVLELPDEYWEQGITEYKDIIKLIVSNNEFDLKLLTQSKLGAPRPRARDIESPHQSSLERLIARTQNREIRAKSDAVRFDDWYAEEITIVIVRPLYS